MISMPEQPQRAYMHLIEGLALLDFLDNDELEELAHSLERACGLNDMQDLKSCRVLAEMVRSYKEE